MTCAISRLAFIDMDGTTLLGTAAEAAAVYLGKVEEVCKLDAGYLSGQVSATDYLQSVAGFYAGRSEDELKVAYSKAPLRAGIEEFIALLHQAGWRCFLCTITWSFAARAIASRVGFDGYCGAQMRIENGVLTGEVLNSFSERDKADFALQMCRLHHVDPKECLAVGDSRSDVCLFKVVGTSIAIGECEDLARVATYVRSVDNFFELVPILPRPLTQG